MPKDSSTPLSIRIRSLSGDFYSIGPGKAALLAAIRDTGSIAAAGRALGMSYQKTRQLVDEMNESFVSPLVAGHKGGAQSGGAVLTDVGCEVLDRFRAIEAQAESTFAGNLEALRRLMTR